MNHGESTFSFITGLLAGAGIMYLMDPDRGNRRRSLVRDKTVSLANQASDMIQSTAERMPVIESSVQRTRQSAQLRTRPTGS